MKIAIVTGASSGMGREFVKQLDKMAKHSDDVHARGMVFDEIWVISRSVGKLFELEKQVSCKISVCPADLTKHDDLQRIKKLLQKEKPSIRLLVNCAGYGIHGPVIHSDYADELGMIDINCKALTAMTHLCLPYMCKGGRMIQMASSAAFVPQPKFAVYAASKSYVMSFSRALNAELYKRNITVTVVCPGPVDTDFFKRDNCNIKKTFYRRMTMAKADKVVKKALIDAVNRKEMSVYGFGMQSFRLLAKIMPHSLLLDIMKYIL